MKSFSDNSFYLLFDEILHRDRPKDSPAAWQAAGVSWHHARHTFEGQNYGFTIEVFEGVHTAKEGWALMVIKEHWWMGRHGETLRSTHWAKPMRGRRDAIMRWLKDRKREIEGTL